MKFWFRGTKCLPLARNKKHAAHKVLWLEATFLRGCVRFAWVVNLSPWWYFGKLRVNQLRFRHLPHPGCEGLQSFLFDSRHLIFVSLSLSLRLARYPTLPTVLENGMRIWATRTICQDSRDQRPRTWNRSKSSLSFKLSSRLDLYSPKDFSLAPSNTVNQLAVPPLPSRRRSTSQFNTARQFIIGPLQVDVL